MSNVINRTTLQFIPSVNEPDYPLTDWIHDPDMSAVKDVERKYWKIEGNRVLEMNRTEKTAVDADEATKEAERFLDDPLTRREFESYKGTL